MTEVPRTIRRAAGAETPASQATSGRPKVVLYVRYTSSRQNEMSCEHQSAQARATARQLSLEVAGEFRDKATSGRTLLRTRGRMEMKTRLARGNVSVFVVERIDRIGRRAAEVIGFAEWFEVRGVSLHVANCIEMDWRLVPFYDAIAEIRPRKTGDNTRRGRISTTKRGRVAADLAYGHRVVSGSTSLNRAIDENKAIIVQRIFGDGAR